MANLLRPLLSEDWTMAEIYGNLWEFNLARVVVVDVSDDYTLMQPPMPSDCYPVVKDTYLPRHNLSNELSRGDLVMGYLYDWHEAPSDEGDCWYVGVVRETLAKSLGEKTLGEKTLGATN